MISRRKFIKSGMLAGAGMLASCAESHRAVEVELREEDEGASLKKFVERLPMPTVLRPDPGEPVEMVMREGRQVLHQDLGQTVVWGYNGHYPGPTLEVQRDQPVRVRWLNRLPPSHRLFVDHCLHGPKSYRDGRTHPQPRAVVHLHGGHVSPESDGYPEATLLPGESATYEYPNRQNASTLWYHDHALGITRLNVYMGLAGLYVIRDASEPVLNLPRGPFEVPILIQDRSFAGDGSLRYPERWEEEFFGPTILVNSRVWPYLEVRPRKYRLRIVNGSNARTYTLALDSGQSFYQIGSDGGFLPQPVEVREITLTAGERADVIVDFSKRTGEVHMVNSAPAPFPGAVGKGVIREIMQFRVRGPSGDDSSLPARLEALPRTREEFAVKLRQFNLDMVDENPKCTQPGIRWLINGLGWDDVTEYPELGTTEIWSFFNLSAEVHPIHLHLVQFQILDRQKLRPDPARAGFFLPLTLPGTQAAAPDPNEAGWKDTFRSMPGEVTRIIARFADFVGKYPYHCHILEHEDHEMMRQFQVVEPKSKPRQSRVWARE
jgi:spore coat protein A